MNTSRGPDEVLSREGRLLPLSFMRLALAQRHFTETGQALGGLESEADQKRDRLRSPLDTATWKLGPSRLVLRRVLRQV